MSQELTLAELELLFQRVGERLEEQATLYLIGGMALHFLGNPRPTFDLDYVGADLPGGQQAFQNLVAQVAEEMQIEVEAVPLEEFLPLPEGAERRHRLIGEYGALRVYVFDPYSIALSKIERGFDTDLADVLFLLRSGVIHWETLQTQAQTVLSEATAYLIDPQTFQAHLEKVQRSLESG